MVFLIHTHHIYNINHRHRNPQKEYIAPLLCQKNLSVKEDGGALDQRNN